MNTPVVHVGNAAWCMQNHGSTIYAYDGLDSLLAGGPKNELSGPGAKPVTERPD